MGADKAEGCAAKTRAALLHAERNLDGKESGSTPETTSSSTNTGTTKKEAVALPRIEGAGKPGGSPFLGCPVWLRNWNQHIADCKEKSRYNALFCTRFTISANLSHLVRDAKERIIGSCNCDREAVQKKASSDTPPAQESNAGGSNYPEEVQYGSVMMGELNAESSTSHTASKRCFSNWCESLRKLDFAARKQVLEANQDCEERAGGCLKGAREQKFEKNGGQGTKGKGCGKQHVGSELFCPTAKCLQWPGLSLDLSTLSMLPDGHNLAWSVHQSFTFSIEFDTIAE